ncbi:MAG: aminodeoxychorismate/anthranilate synthase component II [Treponema sp.]|jgi:anthranilate synthase component 2|nr:aminodeoxychorismate/anthranilate synthase component II [Treponema sp.]
MIVLIDNYDSFSFNLYQLIGALDPDIRVVRNDEVSLEDMVVMRPSRIVISPGPGRPADAGMCEGVIASFAGKIPLLGVCLGHQAIGEVFGATVSYAKTLMHGKASAITLDTSCPLFTGLPRVIQGARYHSLAVDAATIPETLSITAVSDDGEIMGIRCRNQPIYGVQFHPESILTPYGKQMLANFLAEKAVW